MPELPDVESIRRRLRPLVRRRRIVAASAIVDPIVFAGRSGPGLAKALVGRRVLDVHRRGKHLWLELDRRPWPTIHLGMTGWVDDFAGDEARPRSWKLELVMDDGRRVVFRDSRRIGRVRLQQDPRNEPPIGALGFDVLLDLPSASGLREVLARRRAPLKAVLLDQSVFAGVGNWIADEVLYQAGLSPHRTAASLAPAEVARLRASLRSIIARSVAVDSDSERFPRTWLFHHRWGRRAGATTSRREPIVHETIGGRTTAWVPGRQR